MNVSGATTFGYPAACAASMLKCSGSSERTARAYSRIFSRPTR